MNRRGWLWRFAFAACLTPVGIAVRADRQEPMPKELSSLIVQERLGQKLPLEATFRAQDGALVRLGDCFAKGRPVILTLNYADCPQLCSLQLTGLVNGLNKAKPRLGVDFALVTVSIDAADTPAKMKRLEQRYLTQLIRDVPDGRHWYFLSGTEAAIREVCAAVGYSFRVLDNKREIAHQAVAIACAPTGKVCKYLYGIEFPPDEFAAAVSAANTGTLIPKAAEIALLFCFQYDPETGRYVLSAIRLMQTTCILVVLGLTGWLTFMWLRDRRRLARAGAAPGRGDTLVAAGYNSGGDAS